MFRILPALFVLTFLIIFSRRTQKFWFSPGSFFPLIWLIYMAAGLVLAPDYNPMPMGAWILILFSSSVSFGSLLVSDGYVESGNALKQKNIGKPNLRIIYIIGLILTGISCIGIAIVIFSGFRRFQLNQNLFSLLALPNLYATDRYDKILFLPFYLKSIMFLTYPAALIGGFTSVFYKSYKKYLCYLPVFITALYGAVFAVRAGILLSILLTFSGMLCAKIYTGSALNKWFKKVSFAGFVTILILFGLFLLIQWLRKGPAQDLIITDLILIAKAGILGSFSAFTQWLQFSYNIASEYKFGINTFAGPMEVFGLSTRETGFFADFAQIGPSQTNIYTAFRGLIEDFGIIGTVILCFCAGYISSLSFQAVLRGKIMWVVPLSAFYTFALFSPLLSIFAFNSIALAFLIFAGTLIISLSIK